jgi:hypothetical protein
VAHYVGGLEHPQTPKKEEKPMRTQEPKKRTRQRRRLNKEMIRTPAEEILATHQNMGIMLLKTSIVSAIRIGEILSKQRDLLSDGDWMLWLEVNILPSISYESVVRYMRLYDSRTRVSDMANLTEAYRFIQEQRQATGPSAL